MEAKEVKSTVADDGVKFSSDQFSVYAVVEPGQGGDNARGKVESYGKDDIVVATYYVENIDQLPPEDGELNPEVQYIDEIVTDQVLVVLFPVIRFLSVAISVIPKITRQLPHRKPSRIFVNI